MSKQIDPSPEVKAQETETENDTFEMIELAIDDLETLTRAFNLINEVCQGRDDVSISINLEESKTSIN